MADEENKKEEVDTTVELEKQEIPVPEKTVEAAIKKAHAMATAIAGKKGFTASGRAKLLSSLAELRQATGIEIVPSDDTDVMVCRLNDFCDEGKKEIAAILDRKFEAKAKLLRLAKQTFDGEVTPEAAHRQASRILADVDRNDIQRNLMNITLPNRSDKSLKVQIDWAKLKGHGIDKMTRLGDMTVEQLKEVLMSVKGNR